VAIGQHSHHLLALTIGAKKNRVHSEKNNFYITQMLNVTMNLYILSFVSIEEAQYADKF